MNQKASNFHPRFQFAIAFWKCIFNTTAIFVRILSMSLIQKWWNKTICLTVCNLSMGGLLDFNLSDVTKTWFVFLNHLQYKIFTLIFFKKVTGKTRNFSIFSKSHHFILVTVRMWTLEYFERFCRLSKKCSFVNFPKVLQKLHTKRFVFELIFYLYFWFTPRIWH